MASFGNQSKKNIGREGDIDTEAEGKKQLSGKEIEDLFHEEIEALNATLMSKNLLGAIITLNLEDRIEGLAKDWQPGW